MKRLGWKIGLILAVVVLSIWLITPLDKIKLGLDLKGGLHLVLNVEVDEAFRLRTDRAAAQLKDLFTHSHIGFAKVRRLDTDKIVAVGISEEDHDRIRELLDKDFPEWSAEFSGQQLHLTMPAASQSDLRENCLRQSIETIRERVNEFGVNDAGVQRLGFQGGDKILVTLPGVDDPARVKDLIKSTALLEFKHVIAGPFPTKEAAVAHVQGSLPEEAMILPTNPKRMAPAFYVLTADSVIIGDDLKSASRGQDGFGGWEVHFSLTPGGAKKFQVYSAANIGRLLSIVFDKQIESVAKIDSVLSYHTRITGNYSPDEVSDMVLKLQSGALPASMTPAEERLIGPSLGADSIRNGFVAAVTGLLAIMIFMVAYYRAAGVNAVIALLLNIVLLLGAMAYFGFTLTLPGIAGIILTIGMAVDANVLIFERIKEELQAGKSSKAAIDTGFKKAFMTILDANLTTVIAAFFLLQFGSGPVKGFAVTLIIGICAGMFTAQFVSKVIFDLFYSRKHKNGTAHAPLHIGWNMSLVKKETAFGFMNKNLKRVAFTLSGLVILAGLITFFIKGFSLGIDFTGGTMIEASFKDSVSSRDLRDRLNAVGLNGASIQRVAHTGNTFFIKTVIPPVDDSTVPGSGGSVAVTALLEKAASPLGGVNILSSEIVGPQVGEALKHQTFQAVLWVLAGMMVYIGIRFTFSYGLAAVLTLLHDVLVLLTVLLIFNIEVTLPVVAALLTIIGYSLNDTIVIFDRIRDNLKAGTSKPLTPDAALINRSINQTLSRTLMTSATTLVAVLAFFFLGGEVLHDFALTLIVGIVVGTYSSIFQSCAWLNIIKG